MLLRKREWLKKSVLVLSILSMGASTAFATGGTKPDPTWPVENPPAPQPQPPVAEPVPPVAEPVTPAPQPQPQPPISEPVPPAPVDECEEWDYRIGGIVTDGDRVCRITEIRKVGEDQKKWIAVLRCEGERGRSEVELGALYPEDLSIVRVGNLIRGGKAIFLQSFQYAPEAIAFVSPGHILSFFKGGYVKFRPSETEIFDRELKRNIRPKERQVVPANTLRGQVSRWPGVDNEMQRPGDRVIHSDNGEEWRIVELFEGLGSEAPWGFMGRIRGNEEDPGREYFRLDEFANSNWRWYYNGGSGSGYGGGAYIPGWGDGNGTGGGSHYGGGNHGGGGYPGNGGGNGGNYGEGRDVIRQGGVKVRICK